ncbi:sporulation membrane protein YtrI [Pontibacillus sp. HMF3514]|uniref:sporulation membrane protein YtrI n=1 Tax=Pontibacillus sp. HMF3514 TaxID=2692425 RepID=UPI0013201F2A|nr:sporulation membrane protein YtrI [Pontibacillus sp. HMF3514]QHE53240.1 hypothetical protein GS400_14955 [Pontibacillus sp. HMF3514]
MHIPPYYKKAGWQKFFAGMFIGGVIAYAIFLFMYGTHFENWIEENLMLRDEIRDLKDRAESLNKDKEELNEKRKEHLVVQSVEIVFLNESKLLSQNLTDRLSIYKLRELAKEQIHDVIGKDVSSVADNEHLIIKSLESKIYRVDEFTYELEVERLIISPKLTVSLQIKITKN